MFAKTVEDFIVFNVFISTILSVLHKYSNGFVVYLHFIYLNFDYLQCNGPKLFIIISGLIFMHIVVQFAPIGIARKTFQDLIFMRKKFHFCFKSPHEK